ncbi:transposase, partial [Staphylococcus hominis]|uniref:transposase n=1 Tax=Staphylococcus hominis TaxID=1290 RepID=UPI0016438AF4
NPYYHPTFTTPLPTLQLKLPTTPHPHFSPTLFQPYQPNQKPLIPSIFQIYLSPLSTPKLSKILRQLSPKSLSNSFLSTLTQHLQPILNHSHNPLLSQKNYPYLITHLLYIKLPQQNPLLSKTSHITIPITKH